MTVTDKPTVQDLTRDLARDLDRCNRATDGPWEWSGIMKRSYPFQFLFKGWDEDNDDFNLILEALHADTANEHLCDDVRARAVEQLQELENDKCHGANDAWLIAESRTGWPAALRRAIAAEERIAEMEAMLSRWQAAVGHDLEYAEELAAAEKK